MSGLASPPFSLLPSGKPWLLAEESPSSDPSLVLNRNSAIPQTLEEELGGVSTPTPLWGRKPIVPYFGRIKRTKCFSSPKMRGAVLSLLSDERNKGLCMGQTFSSA